MTVVCRVCTRVNPPEARYCYHDGVALPGQAGGAGPIAVGAQPFGHPFVFPTGRVCNNFDELALACDIHWDEARDLLREGFLEGFLGNLGRVDLARAARQAARNPDLDRGLHQLLEQFPGEQRGSAKLVAHPLDINLGQLSRAENRTFTLQVENHGQGLLHGTIAADRTTGWLTFGEGGTTPQKVFQCRYEQIIRVHVNGKGLRAGNKPLEGQLIIESNGGTSIVLVRAEVPVQPFREGVLAGADNPRQLAEKARNSPKEAAALFERGAVARWYESNGWTYPVQGRTSSGLGAVQQFFEALGLVTPPPVKISATQVTLEGPPGGKLDQTLQVSTSAKRPVFALASSTAPWLQIGRIQLRGQVGSIPLIIARVPDAPGKVLQAKVQVTANGNQRFVVSVVLKVAGRGSEGGPGGGVLNMADVLAPQPPRPVNPQFSVVDAPPPVRVSGAQHSTPAPDNSSTTGLPSYLSGVNHRSPSAGATQASQPTPEPIPVLEPLPESPPVRKRTSGEIRVAPPSAIRATAPAPEALDLSSTEPDPLLVRILKHLAPLGLILLALAGVVAHDLFLVPTVEIIDQSEDPGLDLVDPRPRIALKVHDGPKENRSYFDPLPAASMRFGIVMLRDAAGHPVASKKLMYDEYGRTNNTCVRVDGQDYLFGHEHEFRRRGEQMIPGPPFARWKELKQALGKDDQGRSREGARSTWVLIDSKIEVTQLVEVVPGPQSCLLDTCLVRYTVTNRDDRPHEVGLRFLLDTYIGANDGVPFTIPGEKTLCETKKRFDRPEDVPDFIQALERSDLLHPGTVAHLQIRLGGGLEPPSRVLLGGYPDGPVRHLGYPECNAWLTRWTVPFFNIKELAQRQNELDPPPRVPHQPDSAVTLYWDPRELPPGRSSELGFTYGLGQVASGEGEGKLLLTVPNAITTGSEFTLTALVKDPKRGETVKVLIPEEKGFALVGGGEEQVVPDVPPGSTRPISPVTWRIRAGRVGRHRIYVTSSSGVTQHQMIRVVPPKQFKGILD
jgi:hypothetical protein